MALVILVTENPKDSLHNLARMMLGHIEKEAIKQLEEDMPLLMSRFSIEVGADSVPIEFSGLFKNGRGAPWKNGYSLDSMFKEKPKRKQTFRKSLCALSAHNTIKR